MGGVRKPGCLEEPTPAARDQEAVGMLSLWSSTSSLSLCWLHC